MPRAFQILFQSAEVNFVSWSEIMTLGMLQLFSIKCYVKVVAYLAALYILWPGISRVCFDALLVIVMSISYDLNPFSC